MASLNENEQKSENSPRKTDEEINNSRSELDITQIVENAVDLMVNRKTNDSDHSEDDEMDREVYVTGESDTGNSEATHLLGDDNNEVDENRTNLQIYFIRSELTTSIVNRTYRCKPCILWLILICLGTLLGACLISYSYGINFINLFRNTKEDEFK